MEDLPLEVIFVRLLGEGGIIGLIALMIFVYAYTNSIALFEWVEKQTFGTRIYIQEKLDLLFIEVKPQHITYTLLFLSVGSFVITLGICGLMGMWTLGFFLGGFFSFLGFKIPKPIVDNLVKKRIKAYSDQMVDGLTLLANGIRAGLSVPQSLGMVSDEMPAPISQEFGVILQQSRIGVPLEECFENLAVRVPTEDNDMFVSAINILRETGGNLAEVFDTIIGVIRERVRLKQKIDQLTASGMFQGYTIACMPFAIGGIYCATDPKSMVPMFTHPIGWAMSLLVIMLDLAGLFVIMKIVKIES